MKMIDRLGLRMSQEALADATDEQLRPHLSKVGVKALNELVSEVRKVNSPFWGYNSERPISAWELGRVVLYHQTKVSREAKALADALRVAGWRENQKARKEKVVADKAAAEAKAEKAQANLTIAAKLLAELRKPAPVKLTALALRLIGETPKTKVDWDALAAEEGLDEEQTEYRLRKPVAPAPHHWSEEDAAQARPLGFQLPRT